MTSSDIKPLLILLDEDSVKHSVRRFLLKNGPYRCGFLNLNITKITVNDIITGVLNLIYDFTDVETIKDIYCKINGKCLTGGSIYGKTVIPVDEIKHANSIYVHIDISETNEDDGTNENIIRMRLADRHTDPFVDYCYESRLTPTPSYCQDNEFVCEDKRLVTAMRIIEKETGENIGDELKRLYAEDEKWFLKERGEEEKETRKLDLYSLLNIM